MLRWLLKRRVSSNLHRLCILCRNIVKLQKYVAGLKIYPQEEFDMLQGIFCDNQKQCVCHSLVGVCSPVFLPHMQPEADPLVRHKHGSEEVIFFRLF